LNDAHEELQDLVERVAIELISRSNYSLSNSTSSHAFTSTSWTISAGILENGSSQTEHNRGCLHEGGERESSCFIRSFGRH